MLKTTEWNLVKHIHRKPLMRNLLHLILNNQSFNCAFIFVLVSQKCCKSKLHIMAYFWGSAIYSSITFPYNSDVENEIVKDEQQKKGFVFRKIDLFSEKMGLIWDVTE